MHSANLRSDNHYIWFVLLLFYAIATVFHLYLGGDMMYEMRRQPQPTPSLTQGIFNLIHRHGMRGTDF